MATVDEVLEKDDVAPPPAANNFLTESTFGAVGKAVLQPVYVRAHDAATTSVTALRRDFRRR